jgi:hypothetical protein
MRMMIPFGKTTFGVTVWPVLPGREAGQQTMLMHLTWGGPGDAIHLHVNGVSDGGREYFGADTGTVSGSCRTPAEAQQAVDTYLAGLVQLLTAGTTQGPTAPAWPDPSQSQTATEATGTADTSDWQADLRGGPSNDVPDSVATGAHSARPVSPYMGGAGNLVGRQPRTFDALAAYRTVPDLNLPGNGPASVGGRAVRASDASAVVPERDGTTTDDNRYTIRFGDRGSDTAVPDLTVEASGAAPLAEQVLQFAKGRLPGRDASVTVEDMTRGRVFAGMKAAGHFTITPAEQPDKAPHPSPDFTDNLHKGVPRRTAEPRLTTSQPGRPGSGRTP